MPPDELVAEVDAFARQVVTPEWRDGDTFGAEVVPPAPVAMTDCADVDFSPTAEFAEVIRHITGGQ